MTLQERRALEAIQSDLESAVLPTSLTDEYGNSTASLDDYVELALIVESILKKMALILDGKVLL